MNENYPIIVKSYSLSLWYIKKIEKLPKNHRYTLGEKIQHSLIELLMTLSDTIYSKDKANLLLRANQEIERLRLLTKLLKDLSILSSDNHRFIISALNEIGQMIGGWKKTLT
ncbi:MAG: hypothetical protein COA92_09120 [Sulfurovum sp.]|nr:MAG: hypothetical protein COA92_09120 [Sulfurovum sp.]